MDTTSLGKWNSMRAAIGGRIGMTLLGILACGAVLADELDVVLGGNLNGAQDAPEARRVTLGGNLFVEPCNTCNYDSNEDGYAVADRITVCCPEQRNGSAYRLLPLPPVFPSKSRSSYSG
jgi:hypothetical protein